MKGNAILGSSIRNIISNLKNPNGHNFTFNATNEIDGFAYDGAGNIKQDHQYQYDWDGEGQLSSVKNFSGTVISTYSYHPSGLRKTKTTGEITYQYHYDGTNLIRITDKSGDTVWAFTWVEGKPETVTNSNGQTFYYVTNYRGDVIDIIDEAGISVANYKYDPWGNIIQANEAKSVAHQPIGYAGYFYDREAKLYYLNTRYYSPENGIFLSKDPVRGTLENAATQNGYNYANGNPIMMVDPNGTFSFKNPKTSYGRRHELHLNNSEAKALVSFFDSLLKTWAGAAIGLIVSSLPVPYNVLATAVTATAGWSLTKLKDEVKKKNKGKGVIVIYGGSYTTGMTKKQEQDLINDGLGIGKMFTVRSK